MNRYTISPLVTIIWEKSLFNHVYFPIIPPSPNLKIGDGRHCSRLPDEIPGGPSNFIRREVRMTCGLIKCSSAIG
jgi:hypothetical protein